MHIELVESPVPAPSSAGRTPGVHLSKVIRRMAVEKGCLDPKFVEDMGLVELPGDSSSWWEGLSEGTQIRIALGLAWEDWYFPRIAGMDYHPGERVLEGIYMTPDGESVDFLYHIIGRYEHSLHECKVTSKSTNTVKNLKQQWLWMAQLKGYCKVLGTRIAYLHVLFLRGDYSRFAEPELRVWRIIFSQEEIDAHWDEITAFVRAHKDED